MTRRPQARIREEAFASKVEGVADQIADVLEFYHDSLSSEQYQRFEKDVSNRVKSMLKERGEDE